MKVEEGAGHVGPGRPLDRIDAGGNRGLSDPGELRGGLRIPGEGGPLFGKSKDGLNPELNKPLPTGDLSRAAPGDLAGISNARHEVDPNSAPTVGSGGAPTQAQGAASSAAKRRSRREKRCVARSGSPSRASRYRR